MNAAPALPRDDDPKFRRQAGAAGLWALVLLAHGWGLAWGLQQAPATLPAPVASTAPATVQARLLMVPVAATLPANPDQPKMPISTEASPAQPVTRQRRPELGTALNPPLPAADLEPRPGSTPGPAPALVTWPTYAATPPPATTRHYLLQRGDHSAPARLVWAPEGPHGSSYQLSFMAEGGELNGLGAASLGSIGPQGLLPQRHVERRRGRDVRATNIDAAAGWVRGSGGGLPHAWVAGGQDTLSWVVQLAAVLQANPQLSEAGAQVMLAVASARGGVAAWTFDVLGSADTPRADGSTVPSLMLRRPAAHPYDLQVEVWLDPADHHWPLHLRLSTPPGPWESVWVSIAAPAQAPLPDAQP